MIQLRSQEITCYSPHIQMMGLEKEADDLREEILQELKETHYLITSDKEQGYRKIYQQIRLEVLKKHQKWLHKYWPKYQNVFAQPREVQPDLINPRLELISNQTQKDIFRLARLTWSIPYSSGYGRRLRYLVWDGTNEKLIGILGLQSPPLSLPARDRTYNIPYENKTELINQTMDAYTLGALPPYSDLLAGKLLVLAAASQDIRKDYERKYAEKLTIMQQRILSPTLLAVTTLSAFGRSSLYNRVSQGLENRQNIWAIKSLGPSEGWSTSHISNKIYQDVKAFYKQLYPEKATCGFGTGPKIRLQILTRVLDELHISSDILRLPIRREVFIIPHVANLDRLLAGQEESPIYNDQSFEVLAQFWKERYSQPRSSLRCSIEGQTTISTSLIYPDL
jgi:hypothetical protein